MTIWDFSMYSDEELLEVRRAINTLGKYDLGIDEEGERELLMELENRELNEYYCPYCKNHYTEYHDCWEKRSGLVNPSAECPEGMEDTWQDPNRRR